MTKLYKEYRITFGEKMTLNTPIMTADQQKLLNTFLITKLTL